MKAHNVCNLSARFAVIQTKPTMLHVCCCEHMHACHAAQVILEGGTGLSDQARKMRIGVSQKGKRCVKLRNPVSTNKL